MNGVFFIVGPTSIGKTALALQIAEQVGGEIVNADAFQVYDGLGLLTAQPSVEALGRVPHHFFGTVGLSESYNVARYLEEATTCLDEIARRKRCAIVVGGTGLYIKSLTHGLSPLPVANPELRARLEAMELGALLAELQTLDPLTTEQIDVKNKRRVMRALEVSLATGKPFSSYREAWSQSKFGVGEAGVFLSRDHDELRSRIERQVDGMFDAGVVDEVRAINPESLGPTAASAIGLADIQSLLAGRFSLHECKERMKTRTKQYAKRQVTWFKKETIFRRVCLSGAGSQEALEVVALLRSLDAKEVDRIFPSC